MKREIRNKREELRRQSVELRETAQNIDYEKGIEIRKEQDEIYKRWEFYDKLIKASDKKEGK